MVRIVVEITGEVEDAGSIKERLAMDFEKFGDVRIVEVTRIEPKQLKMEV